MLNLLRRSKNKRTQRHDHEDSPATEPTRPTTTLQQQPLPKPPLRRTGHGKFTSAAIDALEDFDALEEGTPIRGLKEKEKQTTASDERRARFAKIYFEDAENNGGHINLATTQTKTLTAGKKPVSFSSLVGSSTINDGRSSGAPDVPLNDVQHQKPAKSNSAINSKHNQTTTTTTNTKTKTKMKTRKPFAFRKVDLDGVNSVIEAILPYEFTDGEYSCDDDDDQQEPQQQAKFPPQVSERSNVNRTSLSQNECAELSGHVSQPCLSAENHQQIVYDIIDQVESNVSKNSEVFTNSESLATKSNGYAGNVRSQRTTDQNEEAATTTTAILGLNTATTKAVDAATSQKQLVNSEVLSNNSKQIKAARRRSFFQRKNSNSESETSTPEATAAATSPPISEVAQKVEKKKPQGPLQKGKKLLSDIFMARGRHHTNQRNRNPTNPTQNTLKQQPPQQLPCDKSNNSNAAVSANYNNCQNAIANKDNTTISETRNSFTADNQNKHIDRATTTTATTMLRRHLESSNSANGGYRDPAASTNQMTFSNYSDKNGSRRDVYGVGNGGQPQQSSRAHSGLSHQRSNSAEHHRERREAYKSAADNFNSYMRAYSEEPERPERRRWSGAHRDFVRTPIGQEQTIAAASDAKLTQASVIRAGSTEQHGIQAEDFVNGKQFNTNNCYSNSHTATSEQLQKRSHATVDHGRESSIKSTACNRSQLSESFQKFSTDVNSMGQTYGRNESVASETSRASTPREFRESQIPETDDGVPTKVPTLPKITVSDCSANTNTVHNDPSVVEHEIFYEFESEHLPTTIDSVSTTSKAKDTSTIEIEDCDSDIDDEVFHEQVSNSQPTQFTTYRHHSPLRHSPVTFLEDVPEQEEEETTTNNNSNHHAFQAAKAKANANDIDNEFLRRSRSRIGNSASISPERGPLKSCDSNLSNSYPDSGISGCSESLLDAAECNATSINNTNNTTKAPARSTTLPKQRRQRSPFVRDSNSTDCDDTLLQCDDLDCFASPSTSTTTVISGGGGERLVCIESISLPDVVESTTSSAPGGVGGSGQNLSASTSAGSGGAGGGVGEQIININGATGNSMGNVHFIPIHIEGERCRGGDSRDSSPNKQQQKRRSIDDNVIGSGMKGSRLSHLNGDFDSLGKPTIEIVEDDDDCLNDFQATNVNNCKKDKMRLELEEQQSRFNAQLEDANKNVQNLQTKINDMQTKIVKLEQELSVKTWNVEKLQSELNASQREDEFVRKKLRLLEVEKTDLRRKYNENEDDFKKKYEELETEYKELEERFKNTQKLASELQVQLARAQSEAEKWRTELEAIRADLDEQIRILQNAFDNSEAERKICEDKWQKEFEMLRTQTMEREETLMTDCEWQLRQMQKQWKDKLDKCEHARREVVDTAELMGLELESRKQEIESLRQCESEVKSLRGVVSEQHNCIESLMAQIEGLKSELHTANEKLEDQMEAVKKIKYQCDNALCDKERQMVYRIDEVRNEAASFWENKLHTEMTRLTNELESVYVDERRDALDKLQAEHIEELRALTTRYTANEDELRTELNELQESYERKCEEFLELRQKSDNTLLQTRMHLDRADREYQNAMCREEERREALEESLRKEFEEEKEKMEAKFRERLEQVKQELSKELKETKQEMTQKHQKDLEQLKEKLRAEKDEALHDLAERHRKKLAAAEDQIKEIELRHQRDLNELKATYDEDKAVLDKRDLSNANEIEQLHRRCRCLTNLFEEMRMRYERRDPRPEDLREIDELRTRCESQERDLFTLTSTLREMQLQMSNLQQNEKPSCKKGLKTLQKPPPKTIPTSCDVIYEENEERDSPPHEPVKALANGHDSAAESSEEDDEDVDGEAAKTPSFNGNKMMNGSVSEVH